MQFVQPIRSKQKINEIYSYLESKWKYRDWLLFSLGINGALRISDLLELKVDNVFREDGSVRERFEIRDSKTGKRNVVTVPPKAQSVARAYWEAYPYVVSNKDHYLFFTTHWEDKGSVAMSRKTTWAMISRICTRVWLEGNYGNHTLRKTWGYHARKKWVDLAVIQEKLNHSSLAVTRRYLWITDDEVVKVSMLLNL